jgi:hypothetical protein
LITQIETKINSAYEVNRKIGLKSDVTQVDFITMFLLISLANKLDNVVHVCMENKNSKRVGHWVVKA